MLRKSSVVAVLGLSLMGLLSGCAGSDDEALKKQSPSPTQTPIESETSSETLNPDETEQEYQEEFREWITMLKFCLLKMNLN